MNKLLDKSQMYTYQIEADAGKKIYLSFPYFNLHDDINCSVMSLSIYEGTNSNGIPTERRCGRNVTAFVSASNIITVKYTTSGNTATFPANHGFKIYYTSGTHGKEIFFMFCAIDMKWIFQTRKVFLAKKLLFVLPILNF